MRLMYRPRAAAARVEIHLQQHHHALIMLALYIMLLLGCTINS